VPVETVWEAPGKRLVAARDGHYLVSVDGSYSVIDGAGVDRQIGTTAGTPALGPDGSVAIMDLPKDERVVAALDDGTVLTTCPAGAGEFGEAWELLAREASGKVLWKSRMPGLAAYACRRADAVVVGVSDISAGGTPAVLAVDGATGELRWAKSLGKGVWRALGVLADGTLAAVLDSGATAFRGDGSTAWDYRGTGDIMAAVIVEDTTCILQRVSHGLARFVYPFGLLGISPDGKAKWSQPVKGEPLGLQQWMGEKAVLALVKNHVLGFEIEDGERLFAERVGADPVDLTGDKLLVKEERGLRLVRLRSVRSPAK
jgi:outer membrane protein assembly factor BamB